MKKDLFLSQISSLQFFAFIFLNVLMLLHIPIASDLAGFLYLLILPGIILSHSIKVLSKGFWSGMIQVVALSCVFVLLGGLFANSVVPLLGNSQPLGFFPVLTIFDSLLICMIAFNFLFRKKQISLSGISLEIFRGLKHHLPLILFPIVAVMGAVVLNNGGKNYFTLALVAGIAIFVIAIFTIRREVSESFLQSSLYFIGLALLLMTSMRSWHIAGYDIHQEFQVFQFTKNDLFWTMTHLQDAYNACLSITILPTIISQFVHLADEYIYKLLYQAIFAILPVIIYQLVRYFSNRKTAFLSAFFIITQVWFFSGMPTLNRQEFGMMFFSLLLLVLFSKTIQKKTKNILLVFYGLAMVVSHYSTTYIAIMLFFLAFLINSGLIIFFNFKKDVSAKTHPARRISEPFIAMLILFVFVWNSQITHTSENFSKFLNQSSLSVSQILTGDSLVSSINKVLYKSPLKINVTAYLQHNAEDFKRNFPDLQYYDDQILQEQPVESTNFQQITGRFGDKYSLFAAILFKTLKILVNNIFILGGVIMLGLHWFKQKFRWSEFLALSLSGFVLLGLILIIPGALKEYNLERLYLQLLILWSFAGVYGCITFLNFMKDTHRRYIFLASVYCLSLLFYSGFIYNFVGGPALLSMNNYGEEYEKNYTHEEEVISAQWLSQHREASLLIYVSSTGQDKLLAFGTFNKRNLLVDIYPAVFSKNSYVYLTNMNVVGRKGTFTSDVNEYAYTYPIQFLDANKNKIYSNKKSEIYQ